MRTTPLTGVAQIFLSCCVGLSGCSSGRANAPAEMTFFITSLGGGDGANLGGLAGADAQCQKLASAAGAGTRTWHAYLSAPASGDLPAVNARDRIGKGPWVNAKGVTVATSLANLHGETNQLGFANSLSERGEHIPANIHDMLTGSKPDGTLAGVTPDQTCHGWTSNSSGGAWLGHYDKGGGGERPTSWNSAHRSAGCSAKALDSTGGAGLFYCFAID
jgi:hypothetical protein